MHRQFEERILEIREKLVRMGGLAESMIASALRMLVERDDRRFRDVQDGEEQVHALRVGIDDLAVRAAALPQPADSDVRFLFLSARITSELERIADQAITLCRNGESLLKAPPLKPFVDLPILADTVRRMVRESLDALIRQEAAVAERVLREEGQADALREQIFRELLTYMMADPATIPRALSLILISGNLERVGAHATHIAEEVLHGIRGRAIRHPHEDPAGLESSAT